VLSFTLRLVCVSQLESNATPSDHLLEQGDEKRHAPPPTEPDVALLDMRAATAAGVKSPMNLKDPIQIPNEL
jgi:hypothetical protein